MKEGDAYVFSNNNIMKSIISIKMTTIIIIIILTLLPYINKNFFLKKQVKITE